MIQRINCSLGPDGLIRRLPEWKRTMRYGSWNIKNITDKEPELVQEMKEHKVGILGLSEVKKKRKWYKKAGGWLYVTILGSRNGR